MKIIKLIFIAIIATIGVPITIGLGIFIYWIKSANRFSDKMIEISTDED